MLPEAFEITSMGVKLPTDADGEHYRGRKLYRIEGDNLVYRRAAGSLAGKSPQHSDGVFAYTGTTVLELVPFREFYREMGLDIQVKPNRLPEETGFEEGVDAAAEAKTVKTGRAGGSADDATENGQHLATKGGGEATGN